MSFPEDDDDDIPRCSCGRTLNGDGPCDYCERVSAHHGRLTVWYALTFASFLAGVFLAQRGFTCAKLPAVVLAVAFFVGALREMGREP